MQSDRVGYLAFRRNARRETTIYCRLYRLQRYPEADTYTVANQREEI
ncbi:hypothetical protein SAMN05518866_10163 [Sphingobium sp. YR768]|nr:hypothetical protein SAMN05518866_10163 [Sphingobium sp. YR768]